MPPARRCARSGRAHRRHPPRASGRSAACRARARARADSAPMHWARAPGRAAPDRPRCRRFRAAAAERSRCACAESSGGRTRRGCAPRRRADRTCGKDDPAPAAAQHRIVATARRDASAMLVCGVRSTRMSLSNVVMLLALLGAGILLWILHADAWDLGRRSPVLNYDTSQYALAGRELAQHGRLSTTFALPVELSVRRGPPWPLSMIQPGMIGIDALVERVLPNPVNDEGSHYGSWARPDQREWLLLPFPFMCFVMTGITIGIAVRHLLERLAPDLARGWHAAG